MSSLLYAKIVEEWFNTVFFAKDSVLHEIRTNQHWQKEKVNQQTVCDAVCYHPSFVSFQHQAYCLDGGRCDDIEKRIEDKDTDWDYPEDGVLELVLKDIARANVYRLRILANLLLIILDQLKHLRRKHIVSIFSEFSEDRSEAIFIGLTLAKAS